MRELATGAIEHTASGMQFPDVCGDFKRADFRQYDAAGLDVSVAYNLPSLTTPVAITAYIYPSPTVRSFGSPKSVIDEARITLARGEFQRCKKEIIGMHAGAQLMNEAQISAPSPAAALDGFLASFRYVENFAGHTGPVESLLYVYCYVGDLWTIKFRVTYLTSSQAKPIVDRFIAQLRWTVKTPNQALLPTTMSVTTCADARVAPDAVAAHL